MLVLLGGSSQIGQNLENINTDSVILKTFFLEVVLLSSEFMHKFDLF